MWRAFLAALLLLAACRLDAVNTMSLVTKQADEQYAAVYTEEAAACLEASSTRRAYDVCMRPWNAGADAIVALRNTTLALDAAQSRKTFKYGACEWFNALQVVDAVSPVELPAVAVGLNSRWSRRC